MIVRKATEGTRRQEECHTFTFPGLLGYPLDHPEKMCAVVPFMFRQTSPTRVVNLIAVLKNFWFNGIATCLVYQGDLPEEVEDLISKKCPVFAVQLSKDTERFEKAKLVNLGIQECLHREHWVWLFQCDADLLVNIREVSEFLDSVNPLENPGVSPWTRWYRTPRGEAEVIRDFPSWARPYRNVKRRMVNECLGAGGIIIARWLLEEGFRWDGKFYDWGWEDAEMVRRLRQVSPNGLLKVPTVGVHLWHENDRKLSMENGEIFHQGVIPASSLGGVRLESKTKFILFANGRSGGNLFGRGLNLHSQIHCDSSEPFIHETTGTPITFKQPVEFRNWLLDGPLHSHKPVVGMRSQFRIPSPRFELSLQWFLEFCVENEFRIIYLYREDSAAQAASSFLASATSQWINVEHPRDLRITVDPEEFYTAYQWCKKTSIEWARKLSSTGALFVKFEDLLTDPGWDEQMTRAAEFLEVLPESVEKPIQKQVRGPWQGHFENSEEIENLIAQAP